MREQEIQQAILKALGARSDLCRVWRTNAGTSRAWDAPRAIKGCPEGHPDIAGILVGGRALFIEVKRPGGRQSEQQVRFEVMVKQFGGVYLLVESVEQAIAAVSAAVGAEGGADVRVRP